MTSSFNKVASFVALLSLAAASEAQDTNTVWDGVYSDEQASRGESVYTETCLSCHGKDLGGNSNSPGLVGMGFMFIWEGKTLGDFFEKIQAEMPTDRPGQLPTQDYLDVIAYILQKNAFPVGGEEMSSNVASLHDISIVPKP